MSGRRWTSRDVAALAGVSVATVSYVMNGRMGDRIPSTTRERVLSAARQLGYSPNRSAQSLRRQKTEQVCLVVDSIGVPVIDQLARDLHAAADEAGYGLITMVVGSAERAAKTIDLLHQRIADGAVIAPSNVTRFREEDLVELARGGLPLVAMDNVVRPIGFDVVRAPERDACGDAMDHLLTTGHRRIAFLGHHEEVNDLDARAKSERIGAYLAALQRHGLETDESLIVEGADDRVAGYRAAADLLRRPDRPDAIFAASARSAISAVWAARDAGLTIPDDVAVVGCGNLPETEITRPPLSTVGPPTTEDFTEVSRLLFERVLTKEPPPEREITNPWVFVPRGSA
ncbi:LacI family DNA-binding transcriptional regulator [Phytoactinopolyspora endophytica]|uniref:LacI family DNA-binding transcriptional regulator n=1 Tax=Phytoactinopolyspora endophytica TaxID=1642495 RepID=UPI00101D571D|nr:LacI family DNA-binding transcriptional regulator [Phytoactinopolyspora endophytica]